jgi:hypothetical protein
MIHQLQARWYALPSLVAITSLRGFSQWVTNPSGFVAGIVFNQIESAEGFFFDVDVRTVIE